MREGAGYRAAVRIVAVLVAYVSTIAGIFLFAFLVPFNVVQGSIDRIVFRRRPPV